MRILKKHNIEDFIFIDIETTYENPDFNEQSPKYEAWKFDCMKDEKLSQDIIGSYFEWAALKAEFARIACITMGVVRKGEIYLMTFSGEEKDILEDLNHALEHTATPKSWLVGQAIKMFDGPFIAKRCLINGVDLHSFFDVAHLKPWDVPYLDTAELWKGTGSKYSSLISICSALEVPSPKNDISGKDVPRLFWEGEIKAICMYCEKDVVAVVQCIRRMAGRDLLTLAPGALTMETDILTYLMSGGRYTDEIAELLKAFLDSLSKTERGKAITILEAIPTKAQGKETDITRADIKKLIV